MWEKRGEQGRRGRVRGRKSEYGMGRRGGRRRKGYQGREGGEGKEWKGDRRGSAEGVMKTH